MVNLIKAKNTKKITRMKYPTQFKFSLNKSEYRNITNFAPLTSPPLAYAKRMATIRRIRSMSLA